MGAGMEVLDAYNFLLKKYGKQNWWPAKTEYEIVVGAILTQNTNWKNAEKSLENLRSMDMINEEKIANISGSELELMIRPSGFYRQKAEYLKGATAKWLEIKSSSDNTSEIRKQLLSVKGIGKETADSILLYALGRPVFVVDSYTMRFCKEFFEKDFKSYDSCQDFFHQNLPWQLDIYKEYHALIVAWGKSKK